MESSETFMNLDEKGKNKVYIWFCDTFFKKVLGGGVMFFGRHYITENNPNPNQDANISNWWNIHFILAT